MPDPDFDAYLLSPRVPPAPRASLTRILSIAFSLCLHLGGLSWLLWRTIEPMPRATPPITAEAGMQLVLLAPAPLPAAAVPPTATRTRAAVLSQAPPAPWRVPAAPTEAPSADYEPPARPGVRAGHLFESVTAAAGSQVRADAPHPMQQPPGVPGRSEAFIDLPIRFRQRASPEQVLVAVGSFLVAGSALASDGLRGGPDYTDPLTRWTTKRMQDAVDPVCNDPKHPRIDARCLKTEE